jgi:hypothetical protein
MSRHIATNLTAAAIAIILITGAAAGGAALGKQPPVNLTPPGITGTAVVGQSLASAPGTWSGKNLTYRYQWLECDSSGAGCNAISGATGSTYGLPASYLGDTLRVLVTASNRNGSAVATSAATAVVASAPSPSPPPPPPPPSSTSSTAPAVSSPPAITGTAQQGQTLTASTGTWSGTTPLAYAYQWQRCDSSGASCAPISGASNASYLLASADVASTIRVSVTASNSAGSATASSVPTSVVTTQTTTSPSSCTAPTDAATQRLFGCASPVNGRIPTPAPIHPSSNVMVQGILDELSKYNMQPFALVFGSTPALDYPSASAPLATVQLNQATQCGAKFYRVPITPGFKVENNAESHMASFLPNGDVYDYYQITSPGVKPIQYPGWVACPANSNWQANAIAPHPASGSVYGSTEPQGWQQGYGWDKWSASASGIIEGAGTVRFLDMKQPTGTTWPHALSISIPNTSDGSVWPRTVAPAGANLGDGQCGRSMNASVPCNESIPEGARIQLDPSINCNTWPSLVNGPEWKRVECRTLQTYGAIVRDTGSGQQTEWQKASPSGDCAPASCFSGLLGLNWGDNKMPTDLYSHLRVVDWTKWTG